MTCLYSPTIACFSLLNYPFSMSSKKLNISKFDVENDSVRNNYFPIKFRWIIQNYNFREITPDLMDLLFVSNVSNLCNYKTL